jgi:hypothetical protein
MSPRAKAILATKSVAFRVAAAARSFDTVHLAAFQLDLNGGGPAR